jgi:hypothetical protein
LNDLITVFPNPTNGVITLSSTSDYKIERFKLYDLNGQIKLSQNTNQLEEEIDLSDFPDGTYILQIHLEGHHMIVRRIVKH